MAVHCQRLISLLEELAPVSLAENWDNVGLLVGDPQAGVEGVLVALDLTQGVIDEALRQECNFILVHHPPIFHPLKRLTAADPEARLLMEAIRNGLNIYAAHTNLDKAPGGVNDRLAQVLGLVDAEILSAQVKEQHYKLVVFVPETHEKEVRQAIGDAGAGFIGNYSYCTFRTRGTGTFLPLEGANPYLGRVGRVEEAAEYRLETIVPERILGKVVQAMLEAHPYEEVAYDLYPLAVTGTPKGGLGRVGNLAEPLPPAQFIEFVKERLSLAAVKVVPGRHELVRRVAVCGGSGGRLIKDAVKRGAQAFITGDVDYHEGQLAESLGLMVIDAGHGATEKVVLPWLAEQLHHLLTTHNLAVPVVLAATNTDPWRCY
ncbi:MAG TPA: Nif3-like dinuclear metal center hexameric protein [Clostridia bacterium]|nr:Nif3-like dinuclear metal center hexameric protein [Clostridia bacterium]